MIKRVKIRQIKKNISLRAKILVQFIYDGWNYGICNVSEDVGRVNRLQARILKLYHVIEKGLTMPETRLGFGGDKINQLIDCFKFDYSDSISKEVCRQATEVLLEYCDFHKQSEFELDKCLLLRVAELCQRFGVNYPSSQSSIRVEDYFENEYSSFEHFSMSRHSVRNFRKENVDCNALISALEIAKNCPSACNRQSWRTVIVQDRVVLDKFLSLQGGNKGFGNLICNGILVMTDVCSFFGEEERNQAYIDGGMYLMNLLYALHEKNVATCVLNCAFNRKNANQVRKLFDVPRNYYFVAFVACGIPVDEFDITLSRKVPINSTNRIV